MQEAFSTIGVRSVATIQGEIHKIEIGLQRLGANAQISAAEFDRAWAAGQRRITELRTEISGAEQKMTKMGSATTGLSSQFAELGLAISALEIARKFIEANVAMEAMQRTMNQITGSSEKTAAEIAWLRESCDKLGISFDDAARSYTSLAAATKGTNLEGAKTKEIFLAVANATAKLGLSAEETQGSLLAITQMVSKGTVSMEEFRGQLAERLPGAMDATAKQLGVTVAELDKMIASGDVMASDMLPALAAGLNKMYGTGQIDGTTAAWNRLKNSVNETFQFLGQTGVMEGISTALGWLTTGVKLLAAAFVYTGKAWGILIAALVNFDFRHPLKSIQLFKDALQELMTNTFEQFGNALDNSSGKANKNADAHGALANATTKSGQAASEASQAWIGLVNGYTKSSALALKATEIAQKSAEARQEETKASVQLTQAFGTEREKHKAAADAAVSNATALKALSEARQHEAQLATDYANALQQIVQAENGADQAHKTAADKATQNAQAKQAEADKATAAALAEHQHAAELQVESEALADNSNRVGELRDAYERAQAALERITAARKAGKATLEEEREAQINAGKAAALYRDSLRDATAAIQAKIKVQASQREVSQALIGLDIQCARDEAELAERLGDTERATEAKNRATQLEIKLADAKAAASRLEAAAELQLVAAKRAELLASNSLTPEKEAELKAEEAAAHVKQVQAQVAEETAKHLRDMADAEQQVSDSANSSRQSIFNNSSAMDGMSSSADRAASSLQGLNNVQSSGGGGGGGGGGTWMGSSNGGGDSPDPSAGDGTSDSTNTGPKGGSIRAPGVSGNRRGLTSNGLTPDTHMVTRDVFGNQVDNTQVGRSAGVASQDLEAFSQNFGAELQKSLAKMIPKSHVTSANVYLKNWDSAWQQAIRSSEADAKRARPQPTVESSKTIKVELALPGGQKATALMRDQASADRFLQDLKTAMGTSSS
jgi:tape measure domain-containing protein